MACETPQHDRPAGIQEPDRTSRTSGGGQPARREPALTTGRIARGRGRTRITFDWTFRGRDLAVHIGGGAEHIGAVALAGREPDGRPVVGVLRIRPHREDELVREAAAILHEALGVNVCVSAGIHVDAITPAEIEAILGHVRVAVRELAARLGANRR